MINYILDFEDEYHYFRNLSIKSFDIFDSHLNILFHLTHLFFHLNVKFNKIYFFYILTNFLNHDFVLTNQLFHLFLSMFFLESGCFPYYSPLEYWLFYLLAHLFWNYCYLYHFNLMHYIIQFPYQIDYDFNIVCLTNHMNLVLLIWIY
jgi:hypothetical protein